MNLKQLNEKLVKIINEDIDKETKYLKNELGEETYNILNKLTERGFKILFTIYDSESYTEAFYDDVREAIYYTEGKFKSSIGEYYDENELILGSFHTVADTYWDDEHDEIYINDVNLPIYLLLNLDSKTIIDGTEILARDYILDNYPNSELSKVILGG